jgi:hypothetical protein
MDLTKEILKEHSRVQANKVADYVGDNPFRFKALIDLYLAGPYRVTQRAAWPISICVEHHPELVDPHLKKLLDFLSKPGIHDSVKRNTLRLLQFIIIPKRLHGRVVDLCFRYLIDKKEPLAVKVFSMSLLFDLIKHEPGLRNELKVIIEDQMPYSTPGFVSRGSKVLKAINALDKSKFKEV